jgi:hypothetical protein
VRKILIALFILLFPASAFAQNYSATAGSGLTFGSKFVSSVNYPQFVFCDPTTPSQCVAVNSSGQLVVIGAGVAGTPSGGVVSVQGVASGTTLPVSISGSQSVNVAQVLGSAISATNGLFTNLLQGNAILSATNPIFNRITDGTTATTVKAASTASVVGDTALVVAISPNNTIPIKAASGQFASGSIASGALASGSIAAGAVAAGAYVSGSVLSGAYASGALVDLTNLSAPIAPNTATATKSIVIGGQYNSTQETLTNGQQGQVALASRGGIMVATGLDPFNVTGAVSNASSGVATGATNIGAVGYNYGWNGTTWDQAKSSNGYLGVSAGYAVSTTMQNGATGNGNGTALPVTGYSTALINVNCSVACSGGTTINFEGTDSTGTFFSLASFPVGGNAPSVTTATTSGQFWVPIAGLTNVRARISSYSAGTITITGTPVYGPNATVTNTTGTTVSHASTTALGTSLVGKASPGSLFGFNCSGIAGGAAGYCIAYNGTSAPGTGALTGANVLDFCYFDTSARGCSLSRIPLAASYSTGIVLLLSSAASPYTYTTGTDTGAITIDYQ